MEPKLTVTAGPIAGCANLASTAAFIVGASEAFIEDNGNNNVIFQSVTNNNSVNNNNINQKTSQENLNCTLGSFCFNSYGSASLATIRHRKCNQ